MKGQAILTHKSFVTYTLFCTASVRSFSTVYPHVYGQVSWHSESLLTYIESFLAQRSFSHRYCKCMVFLCFESSCVWSSSPAQRSFSHIKKYLALWNFSHRYCKCKVSLHYVSSCVWSNYPAQWSFSHIYIASARSFSTVYPHV